VYSASNDRVHQQFFDGQSFTAGQHRAYQSTWNVPANTPPGTYTVRLGTFAAGWNPLYAWNASATAITVAAAGVPTATPIPTATAPPTVPCSPRPDVTVATAPQGNRLRVDLMATGQQNHLLALQFTQTANALVDVGGQTGRTGAFSVSLPGNTTTTTFYVRRAAPGAAIATLSVADRCGSWQTFVGGGPNSGF
jgi:hypothetical protein